MKVLFLTHNFPRYDGDIAGNFLLRFASALAKNGVDVRVVAPAEPGLDEHARLNGTGVARFHYAPKKFETLAYAGNMAEQVRDSWSARFTLLGFLGAEFRAAVRERRAFQPDLIHAHWWFPSGLVGTWLAKLSNTPLVTTMHGSDVRIARSISMSRPAFRHVLQNSRATTAVSRWLAHEAQALVSTAAAVVAPMPVATELFTPAGSRGESSEYVQKYMTPEQYAKVEGLSAWAGARDHTIGELAHAWLLAQPTVCSVISGVTKLEQLEANLKATLEEFTATKPVG